MWYNHVSSWEVAELTHVNKRTFLKVGTMVDNATIVPPKISSKSL